MIHIEKENFLYNWEGIHVDLHPLKLLICYHISLHAGFRDPDKANLTAAISCGYKACWN